jgi:phosphoribosylanthranilate isomerase
LHGEESPQYCSLFTRRVVKAFSIGPDFNTEILDAYSVHGYLLDTWTEGLRGGSGRTFDWRIARRVANRNRAVILAGGLGPSNVAEAIEAVHPYAVDLNSGVEIKPGQKNPHKIRDALKIIRSM